MNLATVVSCFALNRSDESFWICYSSNLCLWLVSSPWQQQPRLIVVFRPRHATLMGKTWFLRNKVEIIKNRRPQHEAILLHCLGEDVKWRWGYFLKADTKTTLGLRNLISFKNINFWKWVNDWYDCQHSEIIWLWYRRHNGTRSITDQTIGAPSLGFL